VERRQARGAAGRMRTPMKAISAITFFAGMTVLPVAAAAPETWSVDPVHSTAQFTARHFGIVPVIGMILVLLLVRNNAATEQGLARRI